MPRALSEIRAGDEFEHECVCDPYRPVYYAAASGDFNPIHIDPEIGRNAGLGGNILQGLCTMAWALEGVARFVGDPTRIERAKVRFTRPVMVGDVVRFRGRVVSVENGRLTAELSAVNQRGEEVLKNASVEARLQEGR